MNNYNIITINCKTHNKLCELIIDNERNQLLSEESISTIRSSYLYIDNIQILFARIATTYCSDCQHAQRMYDYISKLIFLPSTPVIRQINGIDKYPISCFTNTLIDNNFYTALNKLKEICIQLYEGGGCSLDLSNIGHYSQTKSGTVENYIRSLESLHEYTRKNVPRRSAICYYLDISHPNIVKFIELRKPTFDLEKIHISSKTHIAVKISDKFMQKVTNNETWDLIDPTSHQIIKTVMARELFINIVKCRFETGEPFIYYEDNVENQKPQIYKNLNINIGISNLCTEIFIPCQKDHKNQIRNGVCCLGSLNIVNFEKHNHEQKYQIIEDCLLFLDNVLDFYLHRIKKKNTHDEIYQSTINSIVASRAVGLGVMGWHTYLQTHNISFESDHAQRKNKEIFQFIKSSADKASIILAKKLGSCQDHKDNDTIGRFSLKIAIAPNSHISAIANVSPGINPIVSNYYMAKKSGDNFVRMNPNLQKIINSKYHNKKDDIYKHMLNNGGSIQNISYISDGIKQVYKTAYEIDQKYHIQLCADRGQILNEEQGQSINLFINKNITFKEIVKLHILAHRLGIKTLYYLFNSPVIQSNNESHHDNICYSCSS